MDKKYIELFKDLAQSTILSAEQVMDYDLQKEDKNGYAAAELMRNNFDDLKNRIEQSENYRLTKSDAAKLTVGALILVGQLEDRINNLKRALAGYQTDIIPKLQEIVEAENDEVADQMANEKFIIEDNK